MKLFNNEFFSTLGGVSLTLLFAVISQYLSQLNVIAELGINSLIIAIILGILYGNTLRSRLPTFFIPGIHFSAKRILRLAIILYGFRVSFQQIAAVGLEGFLIDVMVVTSTLILGVWLGQRVFKLDRDLSILISAGAAICGAAAVLAVEDVLKSESYKAAVAVGTVVLFGTASMFLYPALQHLNVLGFTTEQFGIFIGASVHEVAQALVAGSQISQQTGNTAVIVKMIRVLLLVPVIFTLSLYLSRKTVSNNQATSITIPWFAIIFIGVIGFNSLHLLSTSLVNSINYLDSFLLTMAMAAIGIETNLAKIKQVGLKPLYLAMLLFAWLGISVYLLVKSINI